VPKTVEVILESVDVRTKVVLTIEDVRDAVLTYPERGNPGTVVAEPRPWTVDIKLPVVTPLTCVPKTVDVILESVDVRTKVVLTIEDVRDAVLTYPERGNPGTVVADPRPWTVEIRFATITPLPVAEVSTARPPE